MTETKKIQDLEARIKTLETQLVKETERRVKFKPIAELEAKVASLEKDVARERASRRRLVNAFVALQELKLPEAKQPRTITLTKYMQATHELQPSDFT